MVIGGDEPTGNDDVAVIRTTNFTNNGVINYDNVVYRQIKNDVVLKKKLICGDIIIEKSGGSDNFPVGRVVYYDRIDEIYLCNNFTSILRTNKELVVSKYLLYLMLNLYKKGVTTKFQNKTTGIRNLQLTSYLANTVINIHDIQTQKDIVAVLDKITSLINMRKEQLEKLDILVKSKFIEMFGDNVIASQYSNKISDIALKIGDGLHGTPNYDETGIYAFINGNNLDNGKININKNTKFININEYNRLRKNISNNTILLSINGTLGKLAYYNGEEVALGKSVCYIDLKDSINRVFFYHVLNSNIFQQYLENNANKSTIKNVNLEKIRNCNIFIPSLDLQNQFAEFVEQVEKNKENIKSSLNQLETLYSALMQEYFG